MERLHYQGNGSELREKRCYGGLDLSVKSDFTAFSLCWPIDDLYVCAEWYWIPSEKVIELGKLCKKPFDLWVQQGWINAVPGPVVNYEAVKADILGLRRLFSFDQIRYDPAFSDTVSEKLSEEGFEMVKFGQTEGWFNEPTRALLDLLLMRRIVQEDNPVSNFNADCLSIKSNDKDQVKPVKPDRFKAGKRIDGMVARIMALDGALRNSHVETVPGFLFV